VPEGMAPVLRAHPARPAARRPAVLPAAGQGHPHRDLGVQMGTELIVRQHARTFDTNRFDLSPWRDALPRVYRYLHAAGIDSDRMPSVLAEIQSRLQALLPLHDHENPVEIALAETAQWVEEQRERAQFRRSPAADATPASAPLDMPEQPVPLNGLGRSRGEQPPRGGGPPEPSFDGRGPARAIRGRRALFF